MKRKTNKTKEEAWSQTAHAPDGEQPGPEASDTSGQSVPKSKFRKKSQQEQAAAAKLRMESQGEKLEQAREKLAKQKPPKKPGPVKRIGRVASGSVHSFVHGKIFEVEQENVGTEGAHRSELVGETALRHGSRFVRRKVREHPAKVVRKPGDLVFFKGTYDTPGVSHCGIYVGDGKMLHCGDPIGYTNLNTSYWQSHFYAYGRLP